MTKYIELLRKHQQEQQPTPTANDSMIEVGLGSETSLPMHAATHNPYSQPCQPSSTAQDDDAQLQPLAGLDGLIEEAEPETASDDSSNPLSDDILLAEDEAEPIVMAEVTTTARATPDNSKATAETPAPNMLSTADKSNTDLNTASFHLPTWLQHVAQEVLTIFQAAQKQEAADISPISEQLRLILDHLAATPGALDALELEINRTIKNIRGFDESVGALVQKSMMMMLYAIKTGQQLKLQQQELVHHMLAAMLHHIGMAMVPDAIRHKKERLTRDEIQRIKEAPQDGHAYLQSCHIEDENILLAASQAAERYDGSGGTGLKGHEIAWSARIIGLLSMFEALIHFRPYRQRLLPRDAIRELVNHHKKAFDPVMLKALIESISLYPVGTFVQINTGEIGQVIAIHNKFPLRPIIHINMDRHGNPINEREINLKTQPNLMIQKCMYEEALAEMREESAHR